MYEEHWQLKCRPFENAAHAEFYYPSEIHQGALLKLRYTIENSRGGAVLAGASGLGKSLLVDSLFRSLPDEFQPRVHVVFPQMPADQLMAFVTTEMTESVQPPQTISESVASLKDFFKKNSASGRHAVVAIDEAHLVADKQSLEALRMLLNFQTDGQPHLTLLLVGQPGLLANLDRSRSLRDRVGVQSLLRPFNLDETVSYISHRMTVAGAPRNCFEDKAMDTIHELTQGIPRNINRLCDLALLIGFADGRQMITSDSIESVSEEMMAIAPE